MAEKKKGFTIGDYNTPDFVSKSDTPPAAVQVIEIPIQSVQINEKNFYDTSNVEELVKSIALNGLIEPIIVMPTEPIPGAAGPAYRIISGHRRFSAWWELSSDDPVKYAAIPAIVKIPANEIMEEMLLIEANRATRVMSSADTMRQAERYTDLLARLKEQGVEIPGRLRDVVADAMQISASRLARLNVIRNGLIPELMTKFETDKLNESAAYELARIKPENQKLMARKDGQKLTASDVSELDKFATKSFETHKCECDETTRCDHGEAFWNASKGKGSWDRCGPGAYSSSSKCCVSCDKSKKCSYVCQKALPEITRRRKQAEKDAENRKAKEQKALDKENKKFGKDWTRIVNLCEAAGAPRPEIVKAFGCSSDESLEKRMNGEFERYDYMKDLERFGMERLKTLSRLSGCSINKLIGLKFGEDDDPSSGEDAWKTASETHPKNGEFVLVIKSKSAVIEQAVYYNYDFMDATDHSQANNRIKDVEYWAYPPDLPDGKEFPGQATIEKLAKGELP